MSNIEKQATPAVPINELLQMRWSPYLFSDKPVHSKDLIALFEAARWTPSSYNEQPWQYILATKGQKEAYEKLLSCLVDANQDWAQHAPVLALGIVRHNFLQGNESNRAAIHDLGAASMSICIEAATRGLHVHQMIGIDPDKARRCYQLPENTEAYTALAIGYLGNLQDANEMYFARDNTPRNRQPTKKFVFSGSWGKPYAF